MLGVAGAQRVRHAARRDSVARLAALAGVDDDYQSLVLRAIGRQRRPDTAPLLASHLQAPDPRVRAAAVLAVAEADPHAAADLLRPLADDESPRVVTAVAAALITTATLADLPTLDALAHHDADDVRERAAEALGTIPDPAVVPLIAGLLADASPSVRREARSALRTCGLADAAEALARNPRRGRGGRVRDARAARHSARRRARAPSWLVATTDHHLASASAGAAYSAALLAIAIALAGASPVLVPVALLLAVVGGIAAGLATSDDRTVELAQHDRARARARTAPAERVVLRRRAALARLALDPRRHARPVALVAAVLGLELLLPTGGLLAAAAASLLLVVMWRMLLARRRILAAGVTTLVPIDARGCAGRDLWLAPAPTSPAEVRASSV